MQPSSKHQQGKAGEAVVGHWLTARGFYVLERNYSWRGGEIDIIAAKYELLLFIEVKFRAQPALLAELVPATKQQKIIRTARYYLAHHRHHNKAWRFDIALVHNETVTYLENAFTSQATF
jgi:putative endonuclease